MKKYLLMLSVFAMFVNHANAEEWTGSVSDNWTIAGNWLVGVPADNSVHAYIWVDKPTVIYSGDTAYANIVDVSGDVPGTTATLNVQGLLDMRTLKIGSFEDGAGIITIDSGTIDMTSYFNCGIKGTGTLIMNSGTIKGCTNLSIPSIYYGGVGHGILELNDGTINTADINMNAHGILKLGEGSIVVSGDVKNKVDGFLLSGWIKAIDKRKKVKVEYDDANNVTTISATSSEEVYSDAELIAIRDGFGARRDQMLASQSANPYPSADGDTYSWNRLDFALASLHLNQDLSAANQAIIDVCNWYKANPEEYESRPVPYQDYSTTYSWSGGHIWRIYGLFNQNSTHFPGRLTPAAEAAILDIMWGWAKKKDLIVDADYSVSKTWDIKGSENQHDMEWGSCHFGAASVLKDVAPYNTYVYDDGYTVQEHYVAWRDYHKEYFRERAKKSINIEIAYAPYNKYSMQSWYNIYDFADDPELKDLAEKHITLYWADWSQDQIAMVRGGSKARCYQGANSQNGIDDAAAMMWYYLGIGTPSASKHPSLMCMATSTHRLPLVVMDMVLDTDGRGVYESSSRRTGLIRGDLNKFFNMSTDYGGILRYSYCTPDFIMGTSMHEKRSHTEWAAISSQNRWHGVIFAGNTDARIYPQCVGLNNGKTYNQHWAVQNKGTQITQKIMDGMSLQTGDMRVYFATSSDLTLVEENDWVFVQAPSAFAAVRPAYGGYTWDDNKWLRSNEEYAPIIIEVCRDIDYADFEAFKAAVLNQTIEHSNDILTYTGIGESGTFTFDTKGSGTPTINGIPVDYAPDYTLKSPFLNEDWNSGKITISKGDRILEMDYTDTTTNIDTFVCKGSFPFEWNDSIYSSFGTYVNKQSKTNGWDSTIIFTIFENPATTASIESFVCAGDLPMVWNDSTYYSVGTYVNKQTNANGCDSIITFTISELPTTTSSIDTSILATDLPFIWNDSTYNSFGSFINLQTNVGGCDSIITLTITELSTTSTDDFKQKTGFMFYPNPVQKNQWVTVEFTSDVSVQNLTIQIVDILGKIRSEESLQYQSKKTFKTSDLQSGIYFLNVKADGYSMTKKLIVL